jgi:hypothetical protein
MTLANCDGDEKDKKEEGEERSGGCAMKAVGV